MFGEKITEPIVVNKLPIKTLEGATYIIDQQSPNYATHGFFKYPCKFIPEIPEWAIKKFSKNKDDIIFDPFAGSGTTLLSAKLMGFKSFGTEIDPIAKTVIQAKTANYTLADLELIKKDYIKLIEGYKKDHEYSFRPQINNLNHWFNEENLNYLAYLKMFIQKEITKENVKLFFEIVFLSIIKTVSNADDSSPKPYVSKKVLKTPPNAEMKFSQTYERYLKMLLEYVNVNNDCQSLIVDGDALNTKTELKANLAITSPPYINAFDYARTLRLENLWLEKQTEESILDSKKLYVGTEKIQLKSEKDKDDLVFQLSPQLKTVFEEIRVIDEKRAYIVKRFFEDMRQNLINVHNKLETNGHYVIVIGNSEIRKVLVQSWKIIKDIAVNEGYEYVENFSYKIQNPYIRIPRNGKGGEIKKDHILVLRKITI